jgi:hypothetical protein
MIELSEAFSHLGDALSSGALASTIAATEISERPAFKLGLEQ